MDRLGCKIGAFAQSAGALLAGGAIGALLWFVLADSRHVRVVLVLACALAFAYWFADGVVNWRRKCLPCEGRGFFQSALSSRLNRPCPCCDGSPAGGGRHPTLRSRAWSRLRGKRS